MKNNNNLFIKALAANDNRHPVYNVGESNSKNKTIIILISKNKTIIIIIVTVIIFIMIIIIASIIAIIQVN